MSTATITDLRNLTGSYAIDPSHTQIGFVARHAMVTRVRGVFTEVHGTLEVDGDDVSASSVTVDISVSSVDTRNADRDAHLRSEDFFDAESHPTITFRSDSIAQVDDHTFRVGGELTIRGVSRPVSFDLALTGAATDPYGNERVGFEGALDVNRKDWGLTWNAALETGGVLVSEKVTLELEVSAVRAS